MRTLTGLMRTSAIRRGGLHCYEDVRVSGVSLVSIVMITMVTRLLLITANLSIHGVEATGCPPVRRLWKGVTRQSPSSLITRGFAVTICFGKLRIVTCIIMMDHQCGHTGYVVMVLFRSVFGPGIHRDLKT